MPTASEGRRRAGGNAEYAAHEDAEGEPVAEVQPLPVPRRLVHGREIPPHSRLSARDDAVSALGRVWGAMIALLGASRMP
jgi:hypothetical protein